MNRCVGSLPCGNGSDSRCTAAGCGFHSHAHTHTRARESTHTHIYVYIHVQPACVEIVSLWERVRGGLGGVSV